MSEFYRSTCELTLKYRDSKEVVIRKAVITLIPNMATFDGDEFEQSYLHRSMAYLLQSLSKPTDRDIGESDLLHPGWRVRQTLNPYLAYVAIGHMAVQLSSKMRSFIDDIVAVIKDHLRQRG
jgi:FKBP12-rapamycin complex-associated protein